MLKLPVPALALALSVSLLLATTPAAAAPAAPTPQAAMAAASAPGALAGPAVSAPAAPGPALPNAPVLPGDTVLNLLQEKGLLPDATQLSQIESHPIVRQMRDAASDLVLASMNFLGVRYRRGGNSAEAGFDCSGFTRYVFEHSIGLVLPRRADQQAQNAGLKVVRREELRPGDLVFFNTMRRAFSHVGIYVGDGKFIHAPSSGKNVRIEDMGQAYWAQRFNGARRAELVRADADTFK